MATISMDESPADRTEWEALYTAAVAFRDLAPWDWMWDADMFAVQNPEGGEMGYCCIMGRLGEHYALAVYQGSEGLAGLWQMREQPPNAELIGVLALQKCLMASFEDRSYLDKRDLEQIKTLGLKFRGRNAWPKFRSYLPGYQPWFLTGPEVRFLTLALQQACEVASRVQDDSALLPEVEPDGEYLTRIAETGDPKGPWKDAYRRPEPLPAASIGLSAPLEESIMTALKRLPASRAILEIDFAYMPGAIQESREQRPWFPYLVMAAEQASGIILGFELAKPDEIASAVTRTLAQVIEQMGALPARIQVGKPETLAYLQPMAAYLGLRIAPARRLKALEAARSELASYMALGPMSDF